MNEINTKCKYCQSENVVKFGTYEGVQRYWCKECKRKFVDNNALPKMKAPITHITSAVSCYFGGMPLDAIQRHLNQEFKVYYSEPAIYYWVIRFAKDAVEKAKSFKPVVGDIWLADETVLRVGGHNIWYFDVIDVKSRYLLASRFSKTRTIKEVEAVMKEASEKAGKIPKTIITDKMTAYPDGIERVFGADTQHIQSKPFVDVNSTNILERFHGTLKDRTKVVRGFKNLETAKILTDAWLVYYNFFKEHETLGNIPPAQKMGMPVPFKDWVDVINPKIEKPKLLPTIEESLVVPKSIMHVRYLQPAIKRKKIPKRKPNNLRLRNYNVISLTTLRMKKK